MKVARKKLPNSVIRVDDGFATLLNTLDDGSYVYEFRYYATTAQALSIGANTVKISVRLTMPVSKPDVLKNATAIGDSRGFIADILTADARAKDTKRDNAANILVSTNSDLTAKFNNSLTKSSGQAVTNDQLGTQRIIHLRSLSELKQANLNPPVLQTKNDTAPVATPGQYQQAALDIVALGIDPSIAAVKQTVVRGTHSAFAGVSSIDSQVVANASDVTPIQRLKNTLISSFHTSAPQQFDARNDLSDETLVPVISDIPTRNVLNTKMLALPASIGTQDFFVMFELIDVYGEVLESVIKRVDHGKLVKIFNTPKIPPRISIAQGQSFGKVVIELEQVDPRATRVRLLRRRLPRAKINFSETKYEFVAEVSLRSRDGTIKFIDPVNNSSNIQYRCVAIGSGGIVGSEFSNAVALAIKSTVVERYHRSNAAAIIPRIVGNGIEVSVLSIPSGVVSVGIKRRDATLSESEFTMLDIKDAIKQVGSSLNNLVFVDPNENLKNDHIYEYSCVVYFNDGTHLDSTASMMVRYIPLASGGVTVEVSNVEIVRDSVALDVRFNITSRISDTNLDAVNQALIKQGLTDFFKGDVQADRENFQKLISHAVTRIDLTTGIIEDFVTFNSTNFSDVFVGRKSGVLKLQEGHRYKYVISTLLRDPETMLESYVKTSKDDSTGKSYSYLPSKYRHPITLNKGTIVTKDTLVSNHPEDAFSFGRVGNVQEVDVTIDVLPAKMSSAKAIRVDRRQILVQWSVDGDIEKIDHFVVIKQNLGHSSIVGKMHNISQGKVFEFFDKLQPDDIGEISYRIVPVLMTFEKSSEIVTNALRIDDARGVTGGLKS